MVPNRAYFSHVPLTLSEFQWAAAEGSIGGLVLGLWRKPLRVEAVDRGMNSTVHKFFYGNLDE